MTSIPRLISRLRRSLHVTWVVCASLFGTASTASAGDPRGFGDLPGPPDRVWQSDAYWTRDFAVPGIDGVANVVEVLGNELYVGGWFTQVDGTETPGLTRFDGLRWDPSPVIAQPVPTAMLADGSSMLVAGDFVDARTRQRNAVMRWSRTGMTPVGGDQMRGQIVRLFRWNGALIAAGYLRFEDQGDKRFALARWSENRWSPLGPDFGSLTYMQVSDAVVFRGRIAVSGSFSSNRRALLLLQSEGAAFDTLLADTATAWSPGINKLEVHEDRLIAGGYFVFRQDPLRGDRNLAAWDGTTWTPLDDEFRCYVTALRSTPSGLLVGGRIFPDQPIGQVNLVSVVRLGAHGLERLPGLNAMEVRSFTEWRGRIVAGGRRVPQDPRFPEPALGLAVYDGNEWSSLTTRDGRVSGLDSDYGVPGYAETRTFLAAGGEWFAGGKFDLAWWQGQWHPVGPVARWAGDHWAAFGTGWLRGIAQALAWKDGVLYAAGNFQVETPLGFVGTSLVRSDGGDWEPVDGAPPGEVTSLAVYGGRLIVTGSFAYAGPLNILVMGIAAFDGVNWSTVGDALPPDDQYWRMSRLLVHDGALYAAGDFREIAGVPARSIARWDGVSWSPVGEGYDGFVTALAVHDGRIVVAGECQGLCANLMAWDGRTWTAIPGAPRGVMTMASGRGALFVAGQFPGSDGSYGPDSRLRAWDGHTWHGLGSGIAREQEPYTYHATVQGLGVRDDVLWVGGSFTRAGGQTAMNVATWTGLTGRARSGQRFELGIVATPNPSRPGHDIDFSIPGEGAVEIGIYDLAGRRLHQLSVPGTTDGASATWDGRDADGKAVPAGIYFARATREGRVIATRRLVRLP